MHGWCVYRLHEGCPPRESSLSGNLVQGLRFSGTAKILLVGSWHALGRVPASHSWRRGVVALYTTPCIAGAIWTIALRGFGIYFPGQGASEKPAWVCEDGLMLV